MNLRSVALIVALLGVTVSVPILRRAETAPLPPQAAPLFEPEAIAARMESETGTRCDRVLVVWPGSVVAEGTLAVLGEPDARSVSADEGMACGLTYAATSRAVIQRLDGYMLVIQPRTAIVVAGDAVNMAAGITSGAPRPEADRTEEAIERGSIRTLPARARPRDPMTIGRDETYWCFIRCSGSFQAVCEEGHGCFCLRMGNTGAVPAPIRAASSGETAAVRYSACGLTR